MTVWELPLRHVELVLKEEDKPTGMEWAPLDIWK